MCQLTPLIPTVWLAVLAKFGQRNVNTFFLLKSGTFLSETSWGRTPLFHQRSSRASLEPVPNLKPVLHISTAKENQVQEQH